MTPHPDKIPLRICGINPDRVIDLLKERMHCAAPPNGTGRKLGLVVEGGGMRGVISAGGVVALDSLGLRNAFNEIYATSAGALNCAYFLAGQAVFGIQIYYKEINNKTFIDFRRLGKVVDIDFVIDQVVTKVRPLDIGKVLETPSDFYIGLIDRDRAESVVLRAQDHRDQLPALLKATTALPVVYNRSIRIGAKSYIDGGLCRPAPVIEAIENGCTDLVVFLTRPSSYRAVAPSWWERRLFSYACSRGNRALQRMYEHASEETNSCRRLCIGDLAPGREVNIATFCPAANGNLPSRLSTDAAQLKQSAVDMAIATLNAFGAAPELISELMNT
jgi:predicted patatin/cPLA2 family phospholipase